MSDVFIDVTRLLDRALQGRLLTGVDRVGVAYVKEFGSWSRAVVRWGRRWIFLGSSDSKAVFDYLLKPDPGLAWRLRAIILQAYLFNWARPAEGGHYFHVVHSGLDQDGFVAKLRKLGVKPFFFLHDLIPITHPEYSRPGEDVKHHRRLSVMIHCASGIIANSVSTLKDLQAYAAKRGEHLPPCVVAHLAPADLPAGALEPALERPYFLMLGTIEPRKNHLFMLHLWRELVAEHGEAAPLLVIVGQRGWECEQVVDLLDRCPALSGNVVEKSRCSDAELATLMRNARALLFPSFAEGYGIPLVEALTAGLPVLASNLPVFREIAGDIPSYIDPLDGAAWKSLIQDYAHRDSTMRSAQIARMRIFKAPTWQEHFKVVRVFCAHTFGQS